MSKRSEQTRPRRRRPRKRHSQPSATRPRKADRSAEQLEVRKLVPDRQFISRSLFVLAVVALAWIAYNAMPALILLFAAIVLAVIFHGCSEMISRVLPGGRKIALPIVVLLFIGLFSAAILYLVPRLPNSSSR